MRFILSSYGYKYITQFLSEKSSLKQGGGNPFLYGILLDLLERKVAEISPDPQIEGLVRQGLIEELKTDIDIDSIDLHYRRNPLEYVHRIAFELTTECNFNCLHCRNGRLDRHKGIGPEYLW